MKRFSILLVLLLVAGAFGVGYVVSQAQTGEDLAHFIRLRTPGLLLQPGRIPGGRERPELIHRYEGPRWVSVRRAPLKDLFFRPEE